MSWDKLTTQINLVSGSPVSAQPNRSQGGSRSVCDSSALYRLLWITEWTLEILLSDQSKWQTVLAKVHKPIGLAGQPAAWVGPTTQISLVSAALSGVQPDKSEGGISSVSDFSALYRLVWITQCTLESVLSDQFQSQTFLEKVYKPIGMEDQPESRDKLTTQISLLLGPILSVQPDGSQNGSRLVCDCSALYRM